MRDDALKKAGELDALYQQKIALCGRLLANESDLSYHLKTDDIDRVNDLLDEDGFLMEEIDALDFEIGRRLDELRGILGIAPADFKLTLEKTKEPALLQIRSREEDMKNSLAVLSKMRGELVSRLEQQAAETRLNAESLARIIGLGRRKHDPSGKKPG